MSDLRRLIPLNEARGLLPAPLPHLSTIRRWYTDGVRGRKLRTVLRGGRRYVDPDALVAFIGAVPADGARAE